MNFRDIITELEEQGYFDQQENPVIPEPAEEP